MTPQAVDDDEADHPRADRLAAFIELADEVLANGWATRNAEIKMGFDEGGPWTLRGPSEDELKSLVLDLRNALQASSELFIPRIVEDYACTVPDEQLREACERVLAEFSRTRELGTLTWNGEPLEPWRIAEVWLYTRYHHRNVAKAKQLRALDPMSRMAHRFEFLKYLQGMLGIVVEVCDLVTVAKERGHLEAVPLAKGAKPVAT